MRILHTMLRVGDLPRSIDFYTRVLGMSVKIIVVAGLVAIVASLFSALYYLYHDKGQGTRLVKALALRVGLSIALVVFLVVSYHLGWIAPTGLR